MFHMKQIYTFLEKAKPELEQYILLLKQWQKAVNLVSNATLNNAWERHIVDSAQLYPLLPIDAEILVDMGSGAGFPALVLAILNKVHQGCLKRIILIESDVKKTLFLKEVSRKLNLSVEVLNKRIESISDIQADVLTARALAELETLLVLGKNIIKQNTVCLFLKGENVQQEIKKCTIPCQIKQIKSITNSNSSILKITEVKYD